MSSKSLSLLVNNFKISYSVQNIHNSCSLVPFLTQLPVCHQLYRWNEILQKIINPYECHMFLIVFSTSRLELNNLPFCGHWFVSQHQSKPKINCSVNIYWELIYTRSLACWPTEINLLNLVSVQCTWGFRYSLSCLCKNY